MLLMIIVLLKWLSLMIVTHLKVKDLLKVFLMIIVCLLIVTNIFSIEPPKCAEDEDQEPYLNKWKNVLIFLRPSLVVLKEESRLGIKFKRL